MKLNTLSKFSAVSGLAAIVLMAPTQSAHAIPPPDYIVSCPSNPMYQMHHWNMLYGTPQNIYYKVISGTPQYPVLQQITLQQYKSACPPVRPNLGHIQAYEAIRVPLGELDILDVGGQSTGTGVVIDRPVKRPAIKKQDAQKR